ncbi:MAG: hypothetical protein ACI9ZM_000333 [Paracoccaceae bacterium]|jgi:hypothetical protein
MRIGAEGMQTGLSMQVDLRKEALGKKRGAAIQYSTGECEHFPWVNAGILSAIQISPAGQQMGDTAVAGHGDGIAVACALPGRACLLVRGGGRQRDLLFYSPGLHDWIEQIVNLSIWLTNAPRVRSMSYVF